MILNNRYKYNSKTDLLGAGGFGRVYLARDTFLDMDVALKIVNADDFLEHYSLIKEVKKGISLNHPNLVRYLDAFELKETTSFGEEQNWQIAIMEFVPDGELSSSVFNELSSEQQYKLVIQLLYGLNYLHKEGIIHRDLKPSNILLLKRNNECIPKICDFGISKHITGKSSQLSQTIGSPSYVPPEYFENDKRVSFSSDLWSFGVLLYELIVGTPAFGSEASGHSTGDVMKNIITCNISSEINSIPEPFQWLIRQCLVKDRKERVQSCDVLIELLKPIKQTKDSSQEERLVRNKSVQDDQNCVTSIISEKGNTQLKKPDSSLKDKVIEELSSNEINENSKQGLKIESKSLDSKKNPKRIKRIIILIVLFLLFGTSIVINPLKYYSYSPEYDIVKGPEIEMVLVNGGSFETGNNEIEQVMHASPLRRAILDDFYIAKYEVTQKQWEKIMGYNPSIFKGSNLPVENVSLDEILEFINKLNKQTGQYYRLPTEDELVYSSIGGANSNGYKYSGSSFYFNVSWSAENSGMKTHPVGTKKPNELGLFDMSGNVREWYSYIPIKSKINKKSQMLKDNKQYAWRGGSFGWPHSTIKDSPVGLGGKCDMNGFRLAASSHIFVEPRKVDTEYGSIDFRDGRLVYISNYDSIVINENYVVENFIFLNDQKKIFYIVNKQDVEDENPLNTCSRMIVCFDIQSKLNENIILISDSYEIKLKLSDTKKKCYYQAYKNWNSTFGIIFFDNLVAKEIARGDSFEEIKNGRYKNKILIYSGDRGHGHAFRNHYKVISQQGDLIREFRNNIEITEQLQALEEDSTIVVGHEADE